MNAYCLTLNDTNIAIEKKGIISIYTLAFARLMALCVCLAP